MLKKLYINLTHEQQQVLNGSMLGDGSICLRERQHCSFNKSQGGENSGPLCRLEYLQWHLDVFGVLSSKIIYSKVACTLPHIIDKSKRLHQYLYYTKSGPIFSYEEKKWYLRDTDDNHIKNNIGHRIKIVPRDLVLTPLTLAIWYADDGCNDPIKRRAKLCSQGFSKEDCDFLVTRLEIDLGIKAKVYKTREIYITSKYYLKFINIIKPYMIWECFKYKIDLSKYTVPQRGPVKFAEINLLSDQQRLDILSKYNCDKCNISDISSQFNISKDVVYEILSESNLKSTKTNQSGHPNVCWDGGTWIVRFKKNGKHIFKKNYNTKMEAILASDEFRKTLK